LAIILLAVFFGLLSGAIGAILAKVYVLENSFNVPFLGQIEYLGDNYGGSNLVIRNPRNVTVEQNTLVTEAIRSSQSQLVGIFDRKAKAPAAAGPDEKEKLPDPDSFYDVRDSLGQGFIITSDGWLVSSFVPPELEQAKQSQKETATSTLLADYVIIDSEGKAHNVKNAVKDPELPLAYWHIEADSLPVKKFVAYNDIEIGNLVIATGWHAPKTITNITDKISQPGNDLLRSSDEFRGRLRTSPALDKSAGGLFVIDLNGNLVGVAGEAGEVLAATNFEPLLGALFENRRLKRSALGLNYIPLSLVTDPEKRFDRHNGALVYPDPKGRAVVPGSPADQAELQAGDVIVSVNNTLLDRYHELNEIIAGYAPGERVDIQYERDGRRQSTDAILAPAPIATGQ